MGQIWLASASGWCRYQSILAHHACSWGMLKTIQYTLPVFVVIDYSFVISSRPRAPGLGFGSLWVRDLEYHRVTWDPFNWRFSLTIHIPQKISFTVIQLLDGNNFCRVQYFVTIAIMRLRIKNKCCWWNGFLEQMAAEANYAMMTSSNGSIFRVTGHLWGEFTGHQWSTRTKASGAELWCFLWSASE